MSTAYILQTVFEILAGAGLVWAIFHEDRLIAFEERIAAGIRRRKKLHIMKSQRLEQPERRNHIAG